MADKILNKPSRSKLRTTVYIIAAVAGAFLLIVILLAVLLLGSPAKYPLPPLSMDIAEANMSVIHRVSPEITVQFPKDRATLVLTPLEVNNLLASGRLFHAANSSRIKAPAADSYDITYHDRVFTINCSWTESGMTFNINAELIPAFKNSMILADTRKFKVGRLRLPAGFVDARVRKANSILENMQEFQLLCEILISLEVLPDGNIEVIYNPGKIMALMPGGTTGAKAAVNMLQGKRVSKEMLLYLKSSNFDPEQLRKIPAFKFNPAVLREIKPADLPAGLYDELKAGEFNPERIIPLLKR